MKDYAPIFIDAWSEVLASFSSKKILSADIVAEQEPITPSDISVIMSIVGAVDGDVFLSMDEETGTTLASEMLGGMDVSGKGEIIKSAVGELCNMVMGSVCSGMGGVDRDVDITPPSVFSYEEAASLERTSSLCISLLLEGMGFVDFEVSIRSA